MKQLADPGLCRLIMAQGKCYLDLHTRLDVFKRHLLSVEFVSVCLEDYEDSAPFTTTTGKMKASVECTANLCVVSHALQAGVSRHLEVFRNLEALGTPHFGEFCGGWKSQASHP